MDIGPEPGPERSSRATVWATDHHYELLGTRFRVRSSAAAVGRQVHRLLAGFECPPVAVDGAQRFSLVASGASGEGHRLVRNGRTAACSDSWPALVQELLADLNEAAVAGFGGFAVHAGVVAAGTAAIAFPAPSGAGKSTLTAACLVAGFGYVSDEALCVDLASGRVVAYPKPLALSGWSRRAVGLDEEARCDPEPAETFVTAAGLGTGLAVGNLRLAHVVDLARGHAAARLVELPRSATVTRLLAMSFNHYKRPATSFALVARLARETRAWRLEYDDPLDGAALLAERLGSS